MIDPELAAILGALAFGALLTWPRLHRAARRAESFCASCGRRILLASERATATELDVPTRRDLRVFAGYCLAAAVYIAIGVTYIDFLLLVLSAWRTCWSSAWLVPTSSGGSL